MRCDECPDVAPHAGPGGRPWCNILNQHTGAAHIRCPKPRLVNLVSDKPVAEVRMTTIAVDGYVYEVEYDGESYVVVIDGYVDYAGDMDGLAARYPYLKEYVIRTKVI